MSSPKLYMATHILVGSIVAFGAPGSLIYYGPAMLGIEVALAVVLAVVLVFVMMSVSLACMMIMQYAPNPMPMGPSLLAGFGILNLGFLVSPFLAIPGLVWLWILPFDHDGHFDPASVVSLNIDAMEEPHHAE